MFSSGKIAVIGGTGKSGGYVLRELIQRNISFRILLRNAASYTHLNAEIVQGDVRDAEAVLQLSEGCTAIISTLGQPKGQRSIFSQATRNVLAAMKVWTIARYVLTTGLNVDTPGDQKGPATRAATNWMRENYPETTADKQLEYEILAASNIDWTLVRLPLIGLTENTEAVATSLIDCPGTGIYATDLAKFLIRQVEDKEFVRQAPFLANAPFGIIRSADIRE
jgi:uncharacterized protein YbjT (DUF2867 family)